MTVWLASEIRLFLVALQFLTRVPVPSFTEFDPAWLDRSAKYFPAVGLVVGLLTAAILLAASALWPMPIAATVAIGAGIVITGAFHEDGLADTADGLGGGQTPERRLEIMKDSRIGTYGAAALVTTIALRTACLASLAPAEAALALIVAHAAARFAPLVVMRRLAYVGDSATAKAKPLATSLTRGELAVAAAVAFAAIALLADPLRMILAATAAAVFVATIARLAQRLIGGYTGDVLGATEQMAEIAILLAAAGRWSAV